MVPENSSICFGLRSVTGNASGLQRLHLLITCLQAFDNRKLLRAGSFAGTAADAVIGLRVGGNIMSPLPLRAVYIAVHTVVVPDTEVSRNVNAVRTRHAVAAARTADPHSRADRGSGILDCLFLLLGKRLESCF